MAKISRPNEQVIQGRARLGSTSAGQGLISLGSAVSAAGSVAAQNSDAELSRQLGGVIEEEGTRIFQESKLASQSATLTNKTSEATDEFLAAQKQRYSQVTDEKGNPTFGTLHTDIGDLGNQILERRAAEIEDPDTATEFRSRFGRYINSQKVSAIKTATKQQVSFSRASLSTGLNTYIRQAAGDDIDQLGVYETGGLSSLDNALQGGVISPEEHANRSKNFSEQLRTQVIIRSITTDRERAAEMLSLEPEQLGVPEQTRNRLIAQLQAANRADALEAEKSKQNRSLDERTEEATIVEDANMKINAGGLREDQLLSLEGQVTDKAFKQLKNNWVNKTAEHIVKKQNLIRLADKVNNDEPIDDTPPKQIDDLYDHMVNQRQDQTESPSNISEKARLAVAIKQPVRAFAKDLENNVLHADNDKAKEVLAAYTYIKDTDSRALDSSFSSKATMIMESTELLVERGGLSPEDAMKQSKEDILDVKEPTRVFRASQFKSIDDFKSRNIRSTAESELGEHGFFNLDDDIPDETVATYEKFLKQGYTAQGSEASAKAYAKRMMNKTHGTSRINRDSDEYVYEPVEKNFPHLTSEHISTILQTEMEPLLPEGVDPNSLHVTASQDTITQVDATGPDGVKRKVKMWSVTYSQEVDGTDVESPLIDPATGRAVLWTPQGTKVNLTDEGLEEAKEARKKFVDKRTDKTTMRTPGAL